MRHSLFPLLRRQMTPVCVVLIALLVGGAFFRLAVVRSFHAPAGDGLQYYALSQELSRANRFAYGPPPHPLTYTRLPGYPLFLAYVAIRQPGLPLVQHIVTATKANVVLDLGSAVLVFLMLGRLRRQLGEPSPFLHAPLLGLGFVLASPLLLRMSCFALTEGLATFLATLSLYLAMCAAQATRRSKRISLSLLLGMTLGAAQLVRADALSLWPALFPLFFGLGPVAALPPRRRFSSPAPFLIPLLLAGAAALLVFAPWPLRNLSQFGEPHPFAWQWRLSDGTPLRTGPLAWARTWSSGAYGESYIDVLFARSLPLDPQRPGVLQPSMYDSDEERAKLGALFSRYNRERLSPAVDAEFAALSAERTARRPLRTLFVLPLRRLLSMWQPVGEHELPMVVPWLGLPAGRPFYSVWEYGLYALAVLGLLLLRRSPEGWPIGAALGVYVAVRSILLCYTVPLGLTQRMLAPVMPALLMLSACGAAFLIAQVADKVRSWRR